MFHGYAHGFSIFRDISDFGLSPALTARALYILYCSLRAHGKLCVRFELYAIILCFIDHLYFEDSTLVFISAQDPALNPRPFAGATPYRPQPKCALIYRVDILLYKKGHHVLRTAPRYEPNPNAVALYISAKVDDFIGVRHLANRTVSWGRAG